MAEKRLEWVGPQGSDIPIAVSGETGGPGDDVRIEFGAASPVEVQVKRGLRTDQRLKDAIANVRDSNDSESSPQVVFAVDRSTTSRTVRIDFAKDLIRIRSGRRDRLKPTTSLVLGWFAGDFGLLSRIHVVELDVNEPADFEYSLALSVLETALEDPAQASAAWSILAKDAGDVCANGLRRNRKALVAILESNGIKLAPPLRDRPWHARLDSSRELLAIHAPNEVLQHLSIIERDVGQLEVGRDVWYRLHQHRGSAYLQLGQFDRAVEHSLKARDVKPDGIHAVLALAAAKAFNGEFEDADHFIAEALKIAPGEPQVWAANAQISALKSDAPPSPPADIANSLEYRVALCQLAANEKRWIQVLSLTSELLGEGHRSNDVVLLRVQALLRLPGGDDIEADRRRLEDALRLSGELVESEIGVPRDLSKIAHLYRAEALRLLGRESEAEPDVEAARKLDLEDPDALLFTAVVHFENGNPQRALALLDNAIVEEQPRLLAFRAMVRATLRGNRETVLADLREALNHERAIPEPDELRLFAADALIRLGNLDEAERILDRVSAEHPDSTRFRLLRGRIAMAQGEIDKGVDHFEMAAANDPAHGVPIAAELACTLFRYGRIDDAVSVFSSIGGDNLPEGVLSIFADALVQSGDFARAMVLIDRLAENGPLPDWAVSLAADISMRREDNEAASDHLRELAARGQATAEAKMALCHLFIESGNLEEAEPILNELASDADLSPFQRMQTAQLLFAAGHAGDAVDLAFNAYRAAPDDIHLNRIFASLVMVGEVPIPEVSEVGADTHVWLKDKHGNTREFTVYADPPIDPRQREISVESARTLGLIGKTVGEVFLESEGTSSEREWEVERVQPAVAFAAVHVLENYEDWFPEDDSFVRKFSIGSPDSVDAFSPIISELERRKAHIDQVFSLYREKCMPLGAVASALGGSIDEVIEAASDDPVLSGPVLVEWAEPSGKAESQAAAKEAEEVVLTTSALHTCLVLDLLERLTERYTLIAPQSLLDEIRKSVRENETLVETGQTTLGGGGLIPVLSKIDAGDPSLVDRLNRVRDLQGWVDENVRIEPIPVDAVVEIDSHQDRIRETVGHSSFDAVVLAEHGATLYADDLGLRRILRGASEARSFSTVALLDALEEEGAIENDLKQGHLVTLLRKNYISVLPSASLLTFAVRNSAGLGLKDVNAVFGLLANANLDPTNAARMVAKCIRETVVSTVVLVPIPVVIRMALQAMVRVWPVGLCTTLVVKACQIELALLPNELDAVGRICDSFRQAMRG